ncbi:MAG: hypothetical protein Q4G40_06800 [Brachybacterium sp.]|nr:hypothetical protein [Brachybacterium sp.]
MSIGHMIGYAFDRVTPATSSGAASAATRRDALARHLLSYILLDAKARRVLAKQIAGISARPGDLRDDARSGVATADLIAELPDGAGVLALLVRADGSLNDEDVARVAADLPEGTDSRLLVITRSARRPSPPTSPERVVITGWAQLAKRLTKKDEKRADLWRTLGEFGEEADDLTVYRQVKPRVLLDEALTQEMRGHLDTLRLAADELYGRPVRFSARRSRSGARLAVGTAGKGLALEFGPVEDGSPVRLSRGLSAPQVSLGLGTLGDEEVRDRAVRRLRGIASGAGWRTDPDYTPTISGFLGTPASAELEDARSLLWDVLDPNLLAAAGFPLVAGSQPTYDGSMLAVRVRYAQNPKAGTLLVGIGGSKNWKTLLPRVVREFDGKKYVVQAGKSDSSEDLVSSVHKALRSLARKP